MNKLKAALEITIGIPMALLELASDLMEHWWGALLVFMVIGTIISVLMSRVFAISPIHDLLVTKVSDLNVMDLILIVWVINLLTRK